MFDEIERMLERMGRQFDDVRPWEDGRGEHRWASGVRVDVAESDDEVVVTADLPGYEKSDIDVSVDHGRLTLRAHREQDNEESGESYVRRERRQSGVRRTVPLPADVDENGAAATYANGVLTVRLPKHAAEGDDVHHIDVN
jgi:HSP20 family protein